MRVLMVTRESGEDRRYGLGRSLAPVLTALAGSGIDACYFSAEDVTADSVRRRQQRVDRLSRLPFIQSRSSRIDLLRAWSERLHIGLAAADLAHREAYTHVHAHDPWLACGVALGLRWNRARAIRWGLTQHGFGSYSRATHEDGLTQSATMQAWLHRIERAITMRAHWVTAPTQAALAQVARDLAFPVVPSHWRHVPHARPPLSAASASERQAARANLGWSDHDLVVLAVGRIVPLKCFDRVLRACAAQPGPHVHLQILGGGDAAGLQTLAHALGFQGRLRVNSAQDVAPYFHAADVYMSASSTESFGLANLEALCAGLPAICSAVGGVPEVVGDGGWLVPNDTGTLTDALSALAGDAALRHTWAGRALARTAQWPLAKEIAEQYVAIYQAA